MARGQGHQVKLAGVPSAYDESAAGGVVLDLLDDLLDLVDASAFRRFPIGPLGAVDAAEVAILVGPFIPNGNAVVVQILDVGIAFEEPEQLVDDRAQVQLLGGEAGETDSQVEAGLGSEDGVGAGPAT